MASRRPNSLRSMRAALLINQRLEAGARRATLSKAPMSCSAGWGFSFRRHMGVKQRTLRLDRCDQMAIAIKLTFGLAHPRMHRCTQETLPEPLAFEACARGGRCCEPDFGHRCHSCF